MSTITVNSDFVGIGRASKIAGRSTSWILTRVSRGQIDVRLDPGRPPRYKVADILALAREQE